MKSNAVAVSSEEYLTYWRPKLASDYELVESNETFEEWVKKLPNGRLHVYVFKLGDYYVIKPVLLMRELEKDMDARYTKKLGMAI